MDYIILDIEFNQPFQFKNGYGVGKNEKCPFEIIEIGAVKLDENMNKLDTFRMFIKPKIYNTLNPIVERKTKITKNDLQYGFPFIDVIKHFKKWIGNDYILCTWGCDDIKEIKRNCEYYYISTEWIGENIDIQYEFSQFFGSSNRMGLSKAIKNFDISLKDKLHRALIDAEYTAKIFKILKREINDFVYFSTYDSNIDIISEILKEIDKNKFKIQCKNCGRFIKAESKGFLTLNLYMSYGRCKKCNIVTKQNVKFIKNLDNKYFYKIRKKIIKDTNVDVLSKMIKNTKII